MLFSQKYIMPKTIDEIAGNDEAKAQIKQWLINWLQKKKQKPLLIHGPTGIGKTTIPYTLKKEFDIEIIELNTSDLRNAERVQQVLGNAGTASSLSGKNKLLFIDDIDLLQQKDRGGMAAILAVLKTSTFPIILTATDIWGKKLSEIRKATAQIALKRPSKFTIAKILKNIAKEQGITNVDIMFIAENSNGDLRSAIIDLQAGANESRDRQKDIFERMKLIFKSMKYAEARKASFGDIEHDILKLWVSENIFLEYTHKIDAALAYSFLSRADIFDGRIKKRQCWDFLRYSNDLLTAGTALAKKEKYHKFVHYQFPNYLKIMSASITRRRMLKDLGHKISKKLHCNWKEGLDFIPILKHILDKHPLAKNFYQFDEKEVDLIFKTKV